MDGYFYKNSNDKIENFNNDYYIKTLKEQISVLKEQIRILKDDNNRLIKMLEKRDNK